MSIGLALIVAGVLLAIFVSEVVGVVLAVIGLVLMVTGRG